MTNVENILRDHVSLEIECVDRIYLNGYVGGLQRPGQLAYFLGSHRGNPVPSPALLRKMTGAFVDRIREFAEQNGIPMIEFDRRDRKDDIAKRAFARNGGREGVVLIGYAKEKDRSYKAVKRTAPNGGTVGFDFYRASVAVNQYYFYIWDREWGPGFIKFSSYAPFGVRVCLNGHEWAKQQLARRGIRFEALDNGFRTCEDPKAVQKICDSLGPRDVDAYFRRWLSRLPHPFTRADRRAGYRYDLSIWQLEFSLTHVFDRPLHGRQFFEEIIRENIDLGRPDRIQLLFERRVTRRTPGSFRTRVVQDGVIPKLSVEYKHSRLKQYFKEGRALRTETVINDPYDVGVKRSLANFEYLRTIGRNINRRLIQMERVGANCVISRRTFEALVLPSESDGKHVSGLRFGDPRVMALLSAVCHHITAIDGFTNATLRNRVACAFDPGPGGYGAARMSYDLRRLRLKGIIQRVEGKNRYVLTPLGRRIALFFTKAHARIFRPGVARLDPSRPRFAGAASADPLARICRQLDEAIAELVAEAEMVA